MSGPKILVVGTHNQKKRLELEGLLPPGLWQLKTLADFEGAKSVAETGKSFAENAELKAVQQAKHLGQWVLAEDSGLSVDALDGRPGIHSARFAGPNATDEQNNAKLLELLANVPADQRTAHYTCHVAVSDPSGKVRARCEATCHGRIATQPLGTGGFGYDPLFIIPEFHQTFGQLGEAVKSVLSHRARAMRRILPELTRLAG